MWILVTIPDTIKIPEEKGKPECRGLKGVDKAELRCVVDQVAHTVKVVDAL